MLWLLVCRTLSLDELLSGLARQARASSHQPRSPSDGQTAYSPGFYDFQGISFRLHRPLITHLDASILGSASTSSILAIVSDPIEQDSTFIDPDQQLLRLENQFATDGDVTFYNISVQNPLVVFGNLRFRSTSAWSKNVKGALCDKTIGLFLPSFCQGFGVIEWDKDSDRPKARTFDKFGPFAPFAKFAKFLKVWFGAKMDTAGSLDWKFQGFSDTVVNWGFGIEAKVGIGFGFDFTKEHNFTEGWFPIDPCFDIIGHDFSIAGFGLGAALQVCFKIGVESFKITLGKPLEYYRTWAVTAKRTGSIKTSGSTMSEPKVEVACEVSNTLNLAGLFEIVLGWTVEVVPSVRLGIKPIIRIGGTPLSVEVGIGLKLTFQFTSKPDKCPIPCVWREGGFGIFAFLEISEIKLCGRVLLKKHDFTKDIFSGEVIPGGCLFDSKATDEGDKDAIEVAKGSAVFIHDISIEYKRAFGKSAKPWDKPTRFWGRLELWRGNYLVQTVLLPGPTGVVGKKIENWKATSQGYMIERYEQEGSYHVKLFVGIGNRNSGLLGKKEGGGREGKSDLTADISRIAGDAYGTAVVSYSQNQLVPAGLSKVFKPCSGQKDFSKIAFAQELAAGDEIGLLIHKVKGDAWHVASEAIIYDSTSDNWDPRKGGFYVQRDQLKISLQRFVWTGKGNVYVTISFFRKDEQVMTTGRHLLVPNTKYTGADLNVLGTASNLVGAPDLVVKIAFESDPPGKKEEFQETFAYKQFPEKSWIVEHRSKEGSYDMIVKLDSTVPTVVFGLQEKLTKDHRAVFCRVFRSTGLGVKVPLKFNGSDMYGIFVVTGLSASLGTGDCYVVITLSSCTPLVAARQLNVTTWAIRLDESLFKGGTLTIPFRRTSKHQMDDEIVSLHALFHGVPGLFCSQGIKDAKVTGAWIGCIEPRPRVANMAHNWYALLPRGWNVLSIRAVPDKFVSFRLQIFDLRHLPALPPTIDILPAKYVIGNETAYIVVRNKYVKGFSTRNLPISVKAVDATGVEATCDGGRSFSLTDTQDGQVFSGRVYCNETLQIAAINEKVTTTPFRLFTLSVEQPTLFEFRERQEDTERQEGLIQVRGEGGHQFQSEFVRQVIYGLKRASVYKTWTGPWRQTVLATPGDVTVRLNVVNRSWWRLSVWFKGPNQDLLTIPWGVQKYTQDPVKFFEGLGITKKGVNYTQEDADFDRIGVIRVKPERLDLDKLKHAKILEFLDLDSKHVKGPVKFEKTKDDGKTVERLEDDVSEAEDVSQGFDSLFMIEVGVAAFVGGVLVVGLVTLVLYRRLSKRTATSSSTVSGQSSSDEVRQEGLIETIE